MGVGGSPASGDGEGYQVAGGTMSDQGKNDMKGLDLKPFEREMYLLGTDVTNAVLGTSGNDSIDRAFKMLMERVQPLLVAGQQCAEWLEPGIPGDDRARDMWLAALAKLRARGEGR